MKPNNLIKKMKFKTKKIVIQDYKYKNYQMNLKPLQTSKIPSKINKN